MKKLKKKLLEYKIRIISAIHCIISKDYILIRCKLIDGTKYTATTFRTDYDDLCEHEFVRAVYQETNISANADPLYLEKDIDTAESLLGYLIKMRDHSLKTQRFGMSELRYCIYFIQNHIKLLKIIK